MPKRSAALLLYRRTDAGVEVLVGHMGGPFWARKDEGAWSIPKGEYQDDEEPLAAARREFKEETGSPAPAGEVIALGEVKQSSKIITTFAVEGDLDLSTFASNTFEQEWPPRSGKTQEFPELDRAAWLDLGTAKTKVVKGQIPILDALTQALGA